MKILALVIVSVMIFMTVQRRISHQVPPVLHLNIDIGQIQKKIFKDVLTDKDVTQLIIDGKTNTPEFKKMITKKTLVIIGNNDEYLKPLSEKVFSQSRIKLNDEEKIKIIQLCLKDDNLTTSIAENKSQTEIIKRGGQLVAQNQSLLLNIANQIWKDNQLGKKLSDAQKSALLKIYFNNPESLKKGTISEQGLKNMIKEVQSDNELKDFYNGDKDAFVEKLIKNI